MAKTWLSSALVALIFLATLVTGTQTPASAAAPSWWDSAYSQRLGVKIVAADALASGYSIGVTLDHAALVAAGRSLASGNDVRVVRWNGSTWTELDRVLAVGSAWGSTSSRIYFRTQTAVSSSTTDASYYLYYSNAAATAPPSDANSVYDLWDDFSGVTLNGGKWWTYAQPGVSVSQDAGALRIFGTAQAATQWSTTVIGSQSTFTSGFRAESTFRIVSQSSTAQANWTGEFGLGVQRLATSPSGSTTKRTGYWNGSTWVQVGPSPGVAVAA